MQSIPSHPSMTLRLPVSPADSSVVRVIAVRHFARPSTRILSQWPLVITAAHRLLQARLPAVAWKQSLGCRNLICTPVPLTGPGIVLPLRVGH